VGFLATAALLHLGLGHAVSSSRTRPWGTGCGHPKTGAPTRGDAWRGRTGWASPLLKMMAGIEQRSNGEVRRTPGYSVGILPQEPALDEDKTADGAGRHRQCRGLVPGLGHRRLRRALIMKTPDAAVCRGAADPGRTLAFAAVAGQLDAVRVHYGTPIRRPGAVERIRHPACPAAVPVCLPVISRSVLPGPAVREPHRVISPTRLGGVAQVMPRVGALWLARRLVLLGCLPRGRPGAGPRAPRHGPPRRRRLRWRPPRRRLLPGKNPSRPVPGGTAGRSSRSFHRTAGHGSHAGLLSCRGQTGTEAISGTANPRFPGPETIPGPALWRASSPVVIVDRGGLGHKAPDG